MKITNAQREWLGNLDNYNRNGRASHSLITRRLQNMGLIEISNDLWKLTNSGRESLEELPQWK